jgi:hypothetical protein
VIGPARVNGLRVGGATPLANADMVALPGASAVRVELPVPGVLVRYFYGDREHARFVGRVSSALARRLGWLARALGVGSIVVAVLDHPFAIAGGVALLVLAIAAVVGVPAQEARRNVTLVPYTRLARLTMTVQHETICILDGPDPIAWLPIDGELGGALTRELEALPIDR